MAQIIKHRRGSISALKDVTANIGEFVIATGSIGDLNAPVVFVGSDATAGGYRAVSKIYQGSIAPILGAGYGSTMDGTPFYSSTSQSLYILDRNGNINMDLSGNLEGNTISGITINNITGSRATFDTFVSSSALNVTGNTQMGGTLNVEGSTTINNNLTVTGTTNANGPLNVTGSVNISGNTSMTGALVVSDGSATFNQGLVAQNSDLLLTSGSNINIQDGGNLQVAGDASVSGALYVSGNIYQTGSFYTQGDIVLSGSINIGNSLTGDTINFGGEVNSNILPTTGATYNLGSSGQTWNEVHAEYYYGDGSHLTNISLTGITGLQLDKITSGYATASISEANGLSVNVGASISGSFSVTGDTFITGTIYVGDNTSSQIYNDGDLFIEDDTNGVVIKSNNGFAQLESSGSYVWVDSNGVHIEGETHTEIYTNNGNVDISSYDGGTLNLNTDGGEGDIHVGNGTNKLNINVDTLLTGSLFATKIEGTGSLYLQPNQDDPRLFEIYNSAAPSGYTDIHFVGNADLNFFGDDTNYLKIDDNAQTVSIVGVNGVFVSSSLTVTGSVNVNGNTSLTGSLTVASGSATILGGDLFVSGNLQVLGSQTNVNIESHTVDIGDNIIQVNAYSPFQRYAGLSAYDSGSVGNSGSLLWDSTNDYWLFQNANGTSSKIVGVSGGTFGSEASLTSGTFPIATTGNTIGDSLLTYSGTTLSLNGKFSVDSGSGETKIQGNLNISYSGATMSSGLTSNVLFINSNDDIGFISSADTTSVTDRLLGYNTSTGLLEFSSLIDGGTY
jgi:cytoskeletal protein CcmA (bactofilin family)